jgi:hypothetical protein
MVAVQWQPVRLEVENGTSVSFAMRLDMNKRWNGANIAPLKEVWKVLMVHQDEKDRLFII